jgi:collagen beta-1,O-galactosyltransferase
MLYVKQYGTCYRFNDLIKKYNRDNDANITTFKFRLDNYIKETKIKPELKSNVIHTFIISLKPEINRRLSLVNRLKYTNIKKYTIIDAVNGHTELEKYDFKVMPDWIDPLTKRKINVGEIGCFLSHYFIWKYIAIHNIDVALILEDDCIFYDDFNAKFEEILQLSPTNYDYFTLGRIKLCNRYNLGPEIIIEGGYVIPKYSYNAQSYLLTNTGAKLLANELAIKNIIPVDEYIPIMYDSFPFPKYSDYFKNMPKLRAIGLINNITEQDNDNAGSSIMNQPIFEYTTK